MPQRSVAVRNAQANAFETTVGTGPLLRIRTGSPPANCAATRTGTVLVSMTLPSDWMADASSGAKAKSGTWSGTAGADGTAGHYEIMDSSGTTCHEQGIVGGPQVELTTNDTSATNSVVLNFASTTGVTVGMEASDGLEAIPAGTRVRAVTGTTVTLDTPLTGEKASGNPVTFQHDMRLQNTSIATGQVVTISTYSFTVGNS